MADSSKGEFRVTFKEGAFARMTFSFNDKYPKPLWRQHGSVNTKWNAALWDEICLRLPDALSKGEGAPTLSEAKDQLKRGDYLKLTFGGCTCWYQPTGVPDQKALVHMELPDVIKTFGDEGVNIMAIYLRLETYAPHPKGDYPGGVKCKIVNMAFTGYDGAAAPPKEIECPSFFEPIGEESDEPARTRSAKRPRKE
jgi:hypothetical protein